MSSETTSLPPHTGGLMYQAHRGRLSKIVAALARHSERLGKDY